MDINTGTEPHTHRNRPFHEVRICMSTLLLGFKTKKKMEGCSTENICHQLIKHDYKTRRAEGDSADNNIQ